VQRDAVRIRLLGKGMAIQADSFVHVTGLAESPLAAGFLAIGLIGNEFLVIDFDVPAADHLRRHFMATPPASLDEPTVARIALEEMTRETGVAVHVEMFCSFEMAVTGPAGDPDPIDDLVDVFAVGESNVGATERLDRERFGRMALEPQAGGIDDRGVGLRADPAHRAVHQLGQAIDLASDIAGETRPQMAVEASHLGVARPGPTVVVRFHHVARIAEAGLSCHLDSGDGHDAQAGQHHEDFPRPIQSPNCADRRPWYPRQPLHAVGYDLILPEHRIRTPQPRRRTIEGSP